jgi:hypothetical protein
MPRPSPNPSPIKPYLEAAETRALALRHLDRLYTGWDLRVTVPSSGAGHLNTSHTAETLLLPKDLSEKVRALVVAHLREVAGLDAVQAPGEDPTPASS